VWPAGQTKRREVSKKARRALPPALRLPDQESPADHDRRSDLLQHDEANLGYQSERKARSPGKSPDYF
jgi:hypothetical protein